MRTIHVISHTHWDREWYRTFQQFRLKLVQLIDGLLEILEQDPDYKHFMLDGQTIVLDDYLLMRPENEQKLREHIQSGRILIGPWHILPDMFLVGPESHIRNLLEGARTARKFGPKMMIGYMPDSFGHIAQMPQILRGFGIDVVSVWRGLDDEPAEFSWQAPDGSQVLMAYLRDSYSNGAFLPSGENLPSDDLSKFAEAIEIRAQSLAGHSATSDFLIMFGTDHMPPPRNTSQNIAFANQTLKDTRVIHSTLPQYVEAIQSSVNSARLPVIEGELRACKRMHLLPGVLSTRMWIKQRNAASENLLTKWVEPFSTFATLAASSAFIHHPSSLIRQTWRLLMENHPHDSICGCSIDQVHDEMKIRFDQVDQIGEELARQSLETIAACIQTIDDRPQTTVNRLSSIVVFNPHPFPRTDLVQVEISLPPEVSNFEITDEQGNVLPYETEGLGAQELINALFDPAGLRTAFGMVNEGRVTGMGIRVFNARREGFTAHLDVILAEGEPDKAVWQRGLAETMALLDDSTITSFHVRARTADSVKVDFTATEIPGLGWRTFTIRAKTTASAPHKLSRLARAALPLVGRIASTSVGQSLIERLQSDPSNKPPHVIENDFFKVEVEAEGTLSVLDKKNGTLYRGLNRFVDGGDCGDEYNYSPPAINPQPVSRLKSVSVHRGAVRQTLTLTLALKAPAQLSADRKSRSRETVEIPITAVVSLTIGVPRVDIHTEVENTARDHRLRVHFPTPFKLVEADYDGHFEVTSRKIGIPAYDRKTWIEDPRPEVPQRAFTELSEENRGLTLANRGLPEVEVLKTNGGSEIALTLLRCVGWLSRDDFQTRRGHAGPATVTPGAQMPGKWAFDYSIIPHVGQKYVLPHEFAYAFETPLRAIPTPLHAGSLRPTGSFLHIHSAITGADDKMGDFIVSAVKQAEAGNGWLVRGYNPGHKALEVTLTPFKRFNAAAQVNLAEQKIADLTVEKETGSVKLTVKSNEIISVLFDG